MSTRSPEPTGPFNFPAADGRGPLELREIAAGITKIKILMRTSRNEHAGQSISVWMATGTLPPFSALTKNEHADACIVGAGLAGLATTYLLGRAGRSMIVLDDGPMVSGETERMTALAPGTYEYCLVVDGQWISDPLAKETVANPFGGRNSIVEGASSLDTFQLASAKNLRLENK